MNNRFKYFGIIALLCFSFYYTHQFALLMRQKDPIYQSILVQKEEKNLTSINAIIDGEYIIPGLSAKTVNVEKSFQKMKNIGAYLESYLVFEQKLPSISLNQNKDKIISHANNNKMAIALIIKENSNLQAYFEKNNIDYTILTTKQTYKDVIKGEKINVDLENYNEIDKYLTKENKNTNICLINILAKDYCLEKKKILVEPSKIISNNTFTRYLSNVTSGDIIYLDNLDLAYTKLLVENIVYQGFSLTSLSYIISETR